MQSSAGNQHLVLKLCTKFHDQLEKQGKGDERQN